MKAVEANRGFNHHNLRLPRQAAPAFTEAAKVAARQHDES